MAKKLKDYYDLKYLESLSGKISSITEYFDKSIFLELTKSQIDRLEFNQRQELIAKALYDSINADCKIKLDN